MKYQVNGANVNLQLSPEEVEEIINALRLASQGQCDTPQTAVATTILEAFEQFRKEEFA